MQSFAFDARTGYAVSPCSPRAALCATALALCASASLPAVASRPDVAQVREKLATISVPFVANAGQWDSRAAFAAKTLAGTLFVTTEGKLVYSLPPVAAKPAADGRSDAGIARGAALGAKGWAITESFVSPTGRTLVAKPDGYRLSPAKVSYFIGVDANRSRAGIDTYERVDLGNVFDGVNVQLRATGSNVEKIFTVAPRQDPRQIRMKVDGARKLEVSDQGELIAHTGNGPIAYTAPIAFQETDDGAREDVAVRYALDAATRTYTFALGSYDRSRPLVIDPLLKSVYLGGAGDERANAIAVHPHSGYVYVVGYTASSANDFPGIAGEFDATYNGGTTDAFVSRLSPDLTQLAGSTYIGGSGPDSAIAVAIHPGTGEIYVAGNTQSPNIPLGAIGLGAQSLLGGGWDTFIARFTADLKTLQATTFNGGSGDEFVGGIAIHPHNGTVYLVGETQSSPTNNFPVTAGVVQPAYAGGRDAFVTQFNTNLTTRVRSTFLGGAQTDSAHAMVIHPGTGDIFVVGDTSSTGFPGVGAGSAQAALNGGGDAFVARLNSLLTTVTATYLGAASLDSALAVALNPIATEVIVAGRSNQIGSGPAFPGMANSPQVTNAGATDAFVSRLNTALTSVLRSTYLGSGGDEQANGVAVNGETGEIYITGFTNGSPFAAAPIANEAYQPTHQSANDMFVARYRFDLAERLQLTYLGTSGNEHGNAIAIHPVGGSVLVAGDTDSSTFPGATGTPTTHGGVFDAVVSMFTPDLTAYNTAPAAVTFVPQSSVATTPVSGPFPNTKRESNEVRLVITPSPPINVPAYVIGAPGSEICATNTAGCCTKLPASCSGSVSGWTSATSYRFGTGDYIALRHTTPNPVGVAVTRLIVGGIAIPFESSTGDATIRCNLDADGDNKLDALKEGLIISRAMGGLTDTAVTNGTGVTTPWTTLRDQMNNNCGTYFQ